MVDLREHRDKLGGQRGFVFEGVDLRICWDLKDVEATGSQLGHRVHQEQEGAPLARRATQLDSYGSAPSDGVKRVVRPSAIFGRREQIAAGSQNRSHTRAFLDNAGDRFESGSAPSEQVEDKREGGIEAAPKL